MSTRADFWIGRGADAEWLGSVAFGGGSWLEPTTALGGALSPAQFRAAVAEIAAQNDHFTHPSMGWPWPWPDSRTTDYAYVMHDGVVSAYCFGRPCSADGLSTDAQQVDWFPDMTARTNVATGKRSGLMFFLVPPKGGGA